MKTMVRLRRVALIAFFSFAAAGAAQPVSAPAGWTALERLITRDQARAILGPMIGAPLLVTHSRDRRFEVWTYDAGAYLLFVGGVLDYWSIPRTPVSGAPPRRAK